MPRWLFLVLVIVLYQLLIWGFLRSLRWMFGTTIINRMVMISVYVLANALFLVAASRIFHGGIAVFATVLALLWLWFMVAAVTAIVHLGTHGRIDNVLRVLLPMGFLALIGWGWFNAHSPVVRYYTITLDKPTQPFRILLASDQHLGRQIGNRAINQLVDIVNTEKPDIILMPGDIINDDATPYLREKMGENLARLKAPLGIYGTLGNHEFYGNIENNAEALRQSGMRLLRDERVVTRDLVIIGRDDKTNKKRKLMAELMPEDTSKPIIVLDHQPRDIAVQSQLPIDIVVSGHTHRGGR